MGAKACLHGAMFGALLCHTISFQGQCFYKFKPTSKLNGTAKRDRWLCGKVPFKSHGNSATIMDSSWVFLLQYQARCDGRIDRLTEGSVEGDAQKGRATLMLRDRALIGLSWNSSYASCPDVVFSLVFREVSSRDTYIYDQFLNTPRVAHDCIPFTNAEPCIPVNGSATNRSTKRGINIRCIETEKKTNFLCRLQIVTNPVTGWHLLWL